ncbi:hypothetical protein AQUCO_00200092v1 [Aquilegia coerulea]|uniref:Sulfotransferase n=1 Tax=Aquilegia coerulea TaxID=218851 RepID=A0A2G5F1G0_AQUCA|nr:hypothetical protein AQUCO_00200092v1 [Aquilegia coerulea]
MESISDDDMDPLIMNHPNALMPSLEVQFYRGNPSPDLSSLPSPRLLRTHLPYAALPESIKKSNCKIVYITRNPKDTLVSLWHFMNNSRPPGVNAVSLEVAFKSFCNGVHAFGPFFDHVLDYWKESLDNPQKILFMQFEEMKSDPKGQVKKLAAFLGKPFTNDEQVEKVLWRCSLERLKNLEVNKTGIDPCIGVPNSSYFRQGIVGDWKNHFTLEMSKELDEITRIRLENSGLEFDACKT